VVVVEERDDIGPPNAIDCFPAGATREETRTRM